MDIKEIKRILELLNGACCETNCENCEYRNKEIGRPYTCKLDEEEALSEAVRIIEEQEERIAIMSEGGWHFSGTPEIPEDEFYSYVLVWTGDKTVFPLVYHRRCVRGKDLFRYEWLNGDKYGAGKIKAWQYVPKPPKEGEEHG